MSDGVTTRSQASVVHPLLVREGGPSVGTVTAAKLGAAPHVQASPLTWPSTSALAWLQS
jgi:hypothetical protein